MSKIAVLAPGSDEVAEWRAQSGIPQSMAPWIVRPADARREGPFTSIICLPDWEIRPGNQHLRQHIVEHHMVPVPVDPAAEGPDLDGVDVFRAPAAPRPDQELAFPAVPEVSPREQRLREAGVNPALIGMLEDGDLGIIESAIGVSYFRELVEAAAARRSIRPWATSLAPNEIDAHISGIRSIVDFMGLEAREPAVRASLASRTAAAVEARRGLDAIRLGLPERDILPLRIAVSRLLDMAPSREATDEEAGFLPTPAPEAEPVRSWRRVRLQPVVSDPLRDNLRDFMRTAMAEDAARRTRRAQRDRMPGAGAGNSDDEG